ncbi:hypothetical protein WJX73_007825 [Symbiochloris irregularis]|uniref:Uncharacterized protein n=1 Tax=Symbiochloris irregularis TaxID=706552 RepID=A0AAW1NS33_9CHLO
MAKASIAIVLLALSVLLAGPVSARNKIFAGENGRRLLDAAASIQQGGTASGNGAQVFSFGNSFANNNPFGSFSAAGGATAAISDNNGQPSISTSIGTGFSDSLFGQSHSDTTSSSSSNGNPAQDMEQRSWRWYSKAMACDIWLPDLGYQIG